MPHRKRRKNFVDHQVQTALVAKVVRYWLASLASVGGLTVLGWLFVWPGIGGFVGSEAVMTEVLPVLVLAVVVSLLILPLIVFDLIRLSNRFAGPMFRLRKLMQDLADGKDVEPVQFRKEDFWGEFSEAFNGIIARTNAAARPGTNTSRTGGTSSAPPLHANGDAVAEAPENENLCQPV